MKVAREWILALLGTIALLVSDAVTEQDAARAVHMPTLMLLFSFMVVAAQLRLGGFYDWIIGRLGTLRIGPRSFLAALILLVAALSAVFSNDVVCLSVAPVLLELCRARRLDTTPFLLGLACAANIGSAATLIGNPQNMLIGGRLGLHFADYLAAAAVPVAGGLVTTWLVITWLWRRGWSDGKPLADTPSTVAEVSRAHPLSRWQATKGLAVAGALFVLFLFSDWPRELVALAGAGVLLLSRKLHSRQMLGLVDWQVLLLFIGLFIVNDALERTGLPGHAVDDLAAVGIDLHAPAALYGVTFVLSNLVSNVPAVMLLLPISTPDQGVLLALSSTLAGNLFIVGSIANIIVVDAAARGGSPIGWRQHARVGVPVTLLSLAIAATWLFAR